MIGSYESCDDGNEVVNDGCTDCKLDTCGDGQIDEEWFPAGADEETLKKHFRKLAAREHPDVSTAPDADDRFQTLTAEYTRLMQECRNGAARLELAQAWASLGGAYLAVSIAFNDPALSALITTALGSIKFAIDASNAEGHRYAPRATA